MSPDYTMLEFQVGSHKSPRKVRVSLVDGSTLDKDVNDKQKIPVRPFLGDDHG